MSNGLKSYIKAHMVHQLVLLILTIIGIMYYNEAISLAVSKPWDFIGSYLVIDLVMIAPTSHAFIVE